MVFFLVGPALLLSSLLVFFIRTLPLAEDKPKSETVNDQQQHSPGHS